MPQPYNGPRLSALNAVELRPQCALLIGAIAGQWSFMEGTLSNYFASFIFGMQTVMEIGGQVAAIEAFETIQAFPQKKSILLAIAKTRGLPEPTLRKFESLLDRVERCQRRRNRIMHARWAVSETEPDGLIYRNKVTDYAAAELYSAQDFNEVIVTLDQVFVELFALFRDEIAPHLKVVADTHVGHIIARHERKDSP